MIVIVRMSGSFLIILQSLHVFMLKMFSDLRTEINSGQASRGNITGCEEIIPGGGWGVSGDHNIAANQHYSVVLYNLYSTHHYSTYICSM